MRREKGVNPDDSELRGRVQGIFSQKIFFSFFNFKIRNIKTFDL